MMGTKNIYNEETPLIKQLIILFFFVVSLQKYSINIAGEGVTANYVYVFLPFIFWFFGINRRLVKRPEIFQVLAVFSLIYLIGVPGDIFAFNELSNPMRRLASFVVFLFPLFLSLVEFKPRDMQIFKIAVIIASLMYSAQTILIFLSLGGAVGVNELKGVFGSQRYGFVLCFSFFMALLSDRLIINKAVLLQRIVICAIILIGVVFTFSRSSLVSLVGGFIFYFVLGFFKKGRPALKTSHGKFRLIYWFLSIAAIISIYFAFQYYTGVDFLQFYKISIVERFLDYTLLNETLSRDPGTSEGLRYYVLILILNYLMNYPLFGSSYQGLYLLYEEFKEGMSTHSQYTDVFLRTGLLGGCLWLFLLYRILRFCSFDKGLQIGLVSVIIYGFFHETFKESQGSFIFGMLLSFSYMGASLKRYKKAGDITYDK